MMIQCVVVGTFALTCLCSLLHVAVGQPTGETFTAHKEENVKAIATQAERNYANSCHLAWSNQLHSCSRRECYPTKKETEESTCVFFDSNPFCPRQSNGTACNTFRADLEMSFIRLPPLNHTFGGEIGSFVGTTINAQQQLDPTFRAVHANITNTEDLQYFYNLYFGDILGVLRYYPGREVDKQTCQSYDPRKRPWFIGATAIVKDLVVLVDTGFHMTDNYAPAVNSTTPLEGARAMVRELMLTLTDSDRATLIPFDGSPDPILNQHDLPQFNSSTQGVDVPLRQLPPYSTFIASLDGEAFSGGEGIQQGHSNYTTAFTQALSVFKSSKPGVLQLVILLTSVEGQPSDTDLVTAANMFDNNTVSPRLFVYELGDNKVPTRDWSNLTSSVGGYVERLNLIDVIPNPMAAWHAYFDFLVQSRIKYHEGVHLPFWRTQYISASGLGQVVTVSIAAITPNGKLIGVAGLDVQTGGLVHHPNLLNGINEVLTSVAKETNSPIASGADITDSDGGYYTYANAWNCGNVSMEDDDLFCPSVSGLTLESLACCAECRSSDSGPNLTGRWVAIAVVAAAICVVVLSIFFFHKRWKVRPPVGRGPIAEFSHDELRRATNNFHPSLLIGKGSFGEVYKGTMGDEKVAVKKVFRQPTNRPEDFLAELHTAGLARHPNLVELKGICFHGSGKQSGQFFLVYELIEGGDLHRWLWPDDPSANAKVSRTRFLSWPERKKIARGIAKGLNYLHLGLLPTRKIFHLDIKPQNILLDAQLNPKIADFGISQLYERGHTSRVATVRNGTPGYCAPEVFDGLRPNSKLDVYSFGMVLLQLVSGRPVVIDPDSRKPISLEPWARGQVEDGHASRVIDSRLIQAVQEKHRQTTVESCLQMLSLALRCVSKDPDMRPQMSEVLDTIDSSRTIEVSFDDILTQDSPACSDRMSLITNAKITSWEYQPESGRSFRLSFKSKSKPATDQSYLEGSISAWDCTSNGSTEQFGTPSQSLYLDTRAPPLLKRTRSWS